ncbi:MAG: helix-turn-helix domain-containing protein [bacterium]|nr:helix-turn-helix domain-containing protein [bacterium]
MTVYSWRKKPVRRKNRDYGTGARLKKIRESLKYSMVRMGTLVGLTRSGYFKSETSGSFPSPHTLEALSTQLGISMDWFLFELGPVYRTNEEPAQEATGKKKGQFLADDPDVHEMLAAMADIPLVKHDLLAHYQRLKVKNKGLFKSHHEE